MRRNGLLFVIVLAAVIAVTACSSTTEIASNGIRNWYICQRCPGGRNSIFQVPEIRDVYSRDQLREALASETIRIVVSHGALLEPVDGVSRIHLGYEVSPLFVSSENDISNISSENLDRILKGGVRNWKDVGGTASGITLHMHSGENQKLAVHELFAQLGIVEPSQALLFSSDYSELERKASENEGALVLGLRNRSTSRLKPLAIDGVKVETVDAIEEGPTSSDIRRYPLKLPIYLFVKKGENVEAARLKVIAQTKRMIAQEENDRVQPREK